MVIVENSETDSGTELRLILVPHRAMDWEGNKRIIALLGSVCIIIALLFGYILDTWMILPFAGLEVIALTSGLYYASWKLNYRHIITVTDGNVLIDKGVYKPRKSWRLSRLETKLMIDPPSHNWEAKKVALKTREFEVRIGEFLDSSDIQTVIDELLPLLARSAR